MVTSVGDDVNNFSYRHSSLHLGYRWLQSGPNVMDADLYYHKVECCSPEKIAELALSLLTLSAHFEWFAWTHVDARDRQYLPGR